jgi:hypothetical protein
MYAMIDDFEFQNVMFDFGFSHDGASALFHFLEACNLDTPHGMRFDPVAIQCEWHEDSLPNILEQYDHINTLKELCEHTTVLIVDEEKGQYIYNTAF